MASSGLAIAIAMVAVPTAAWLVLRQAQRAPVARPLEPRVPALSAPGPIQSYLAAPGRPPAERIEETARTILLSWLAQAPRAKADAARAALDPALLYLLDGGGAEAWAREEAASRWRGPRPLFRPWYALAAATSSRDARRARYVDVMTRKLMETVETE